uniref:Nucleotid_trans domain-containing protein n=1 Tax=Meloidogyne hapla TaxID=6305 RepID=A0A1I8BTA9_MELHA
MDNTASREISRIWPDLRILEININSLHLPFNYGESADIIFDRSSPVEGNNLIAGGYFFVKPSQRSTQFFAKLADNLLNIYSPDNVLMSSLCSDSISIKCKVIPFCTITNWLWLQNYENTKNEGKRS